MIILDDSDRCPLQTAHRHIVTSKYKIQKY